MPLFPAALIAQKRDGQQHSAKDIHWMIESFMNGSFTDYQMTAWLMAAYLKGLNGEEMLALTEAMLHSGSVIARPQSGLPRIDKHSTGGVGDKISLPLAAVAAACELQVPMIAGRGLGHTGGTLDKLESIPGFSVKLSERSFNRIVAKCGAAIMGQTKEIAPADRRIYALRDVTGTVACRPLIVASILSKKLAEGLDGLVLDVKVGAGAFMKDKSAARALARSLVQTSSQLGTPAVARLSNMQSPLGAMIGNALEVKESIDILQGNGPSDSAELTLVLAEEMLLLAGVEKKRAAARARAVQSIQSGKAFESFQKMVELQGGDPRVIEDPRLLPQAAHKSGVRAPSAGYISKVEAYTLAELALELGAGRSRSSDKIDPAVGIEVLKKPGDRVEKGELLCRVHSQKKSSTYLQSAASAFLITKKKGPEEALLLGPSIRA